MGGFASELWDCFDAVASKSTNAHKVSMKTMAGFLQEFASHDEAHSRALGKTCKGLVTLPEMGSLRSGFLALRSHAECVSKQSFDASKETLASTVKPILEHRDEYKKASAKLCAEGAKLVKDLASHEDRSAKSRAKAHKLGADSDAARQAHEDGKADPATTPQQVQKLAKSAHSAQRDFEKADKDYRETVAACRTFQDRYDRRMAEILTELERMEADRIERCKAALVAHLAAQEAALTASLASVRDTRAQLDAIDPAADNALFASENKTGNAPPPHVEYEAYVSKFGENQPGIAAKVGAVGHVGDGGGNTNSNNNNNASNDASGGGGSEGSAPAAASASASAGAAAVRKPPVQPQQPEQPPRPPAAAKETPPPPPGSTAQEGGDDGAPEILSVPVRALFDYTASDDTELTFKSGDEFIVTGKDDSGWWTGVIGTGQGSRVGLFPNNRVEEIAGKGGNPAASDAQGSASAPPPPPAGDGAAESEGAMATVLFDFEAQDATELSLKTGQKVNVVMQDPGGWWLGELPDGGGRGLFPASYCELDA